MFYIDTNVFLYTMNAHSPYFDSCRSLLKLAINDKIKICTSVETIQEIVFFLRRMNKLKESLRLSKNLMKIIHVLLPIEDGTIKIYLKLLAKYGVLKRTASRDFIHLAVCLQEQVPIIITYDDDFTFFKEIIVKKPEETLHSL